MSKFQENLRAYREKSGITAKDFAAQLGIKYTTYSSYENADRKPKYDTLIKIASALHVSIDELLNYERTEPTLEEWISILDNGGADRLTQIEQIEIKSLLLELQWYRSQIEAGNLVNKETGR